MYVIHFEARKSRAVMRQLSISKLESKLGYELTAREGKSTQLLDIYRKKRIGPKTLPWGTPHTMGSSSLLSLLTSTLCFLSER